MLKTFMLSRGVKLAAACVCPVAGAGVVTVAVPPVRHAVHHFTAPREIALPKMRVRPVSAPCAPGPAVLASPAVMGPPTLLSPAAPTVAGTPIEVAAVSPTGPVGITGPLVPVTPLTLTPPDLGPPLTTIAAVPEARTWLQLVIGFGMVGASTRMAQAKLRPQLPASEEQRA